jgi:hypothetical protein
VNNRKIVSFIGALFVALFVFSCSSPEKGIEGKWRAKSQGAGLIGIGKMTDLEFTKDAMISGARTYPCKVLTNGKFTLDVGMGTIYTYDYNLSGNDLTISSSMAPEFVSTYVRVQ